MEEELPGKDITRKRNYAEVELRGRKISRKGITQKWNIAEE